MKIKLHIFTNATESAPATDIIEKTYHSFTDCFGIIDYTIWCDKKPNIKKGDLYFRRLKNIFHDVRLCSSLSDGYIRAVKESSNYDFLFMLEHDWIFKKDMIRHGLNHIMEVMSDLNLIHMRFNKRKNIVKLWDKWLKENYGIPASWDNLYFCETPVLSNNPHIINRELWIKKCLPYVQIKPGSKGIEENLTARKDLTGAIYGPLNYGACVEHLDGRGK